MTSQFKKNLSVLILAAVVLGSAGLPISSAQAQGVEAQISSGKPARVRVGDLVKARNKALRQDRRDARKVERAERREVRQDRREGRRDLRMKRRAERRAPRSP